MIRITRRSRRTSWVAMFAPLVLFAALVTMTGAAPAQAAVGDRTAVTFNMQGAGAGGDSTWNSVTSSYDGRSGGVPLWGAGVIALQEAGANPPTPPSGSRTEQLPSVGMPPGVVGNLPDAHFTRTRSVSHTQWIAPDRHQYDVYFLQTDRAGRGGGATYNGGRVNLAVLTPRPVDEVAIIPNPAYNGGQDATGDVNTGEDQRPQTAAFEELNSARAALGVRIGGTWYFNIHARVGGRDVDGLLRNVQTFMDARPGQDAMVLGDFNRNPGGRNYPGTQRPVAFMGSTQVSGNTLDYGVVVNNADAPMIARLLPWAGSSDHVPVQITPTPGGGPVPPNAFVPTGSASAGDGGGAAPNSTNGSGSGSSVGQGGAAASDPTDSPGTAAREKAWATILLMLAAGVASL